LASPTNKMIELNYQYSNKIMTSFRLWVKQDSLYNLILLFENKPLIYWQGHHTHYS
jgi:hypothetical protein